MKPRIGIMAAIASLLGLDRGGIRIGSACEIPMQPAASNPPHHPRPVTPPRPKKRKNPMHGICGSAIGYTSRHADLSTDTRRRHNEERRAENFRELAKLIASRP